MRDEQGFTLVELLVAMVLMTIVLGGVLTTFDGFNSNQQKTTQRAEAQEGARMSIGRLTRDMRNAVSAGPPVAESVERAQPDDLIFQTVGTAAPGVGNPSGKIRVRYCLNAADPANARLVRQQQVFPGAPTALPGGTACPGPAGDGWTTTQVLADKVTNRRGGANRPLFAYRYTNDPSNLLTELVSVMPTVHVDVNSAALSPGESTLRSGVQLRNANQPPQALFTVSVLSRKLILNASASIDPERQPLKYEWFIDGSGVPLTGVRTETPALPVGTHTVRLVVTDPANATNSQTQEKVIS